MRSTFEIDQMIAIVAGGAYYDLHNCFDFVRFDYAPTRREVRLEWQRSHGAGIPQDAPERFVLRFEGVQDVAIQRRDRDMPFTEDSCVASVTFLPPDLEDRFDAICPEYRSADEHFSIEFQSGLGIKIWAESVIHEIA
jgi:hypothetical protein